MLKLAGGPIRHELLPGVIVEFDPITTPAYLRAREAAKAAVRAEPDHEDVRAKAQVAFVKSLCETGIRSWEGVGDENGAIVEPTRDRWEGEGDAAVLIPGEISKLLDYYPAFESIERLYAGPVLEAEAEKNGSSPSRTGSSATAIATAEAAETKTVKPAKAARSK